MQTTTSVNFAQKAEKKKRTGLKFLRYGRNLRYDGEGIYMTSYKRFDHKLVLAREVGKEKLV